MDPNFFHIDSEFLTYVEKIERLTGFNFMEKLPDQVENEVESLTNTEVWQNPKKIQIS